MRGQFIWSILWIGFCIWSTELDSGLPHTNTYSCTIRKRTPDIELDEVDLELHNIPSTCMFAGGGGGEKLTSIDLKHPRLLL